MRRTRQAQRGQVTVEFVLLSLMIVIFLLISIQMTWVACQKWYFNFTAAYTARAWSVQPGESYSPQMMLRAVQAAAEARSERLRRMPLAEEINAVRLDGGIIDIPNRFDGEQLPGIWFFGEGRMLGYFQPGTLASAQLDAGNDGTVPFETFIPIEHEERAEWGGPENPGRYDNDR